MGHLAIVTGAAGDIGRACALSLAGRGIPVILTDVDVNGMTPVEHAIQRDGGTVPMVCELDVSDENQVKSVFETVESKHGAVSVLVCCAGSMADHPGAEVSITETSVSEWERVQAVNGRGTFLCVREMLRCRQRRPLAHGRIVTMSSAAAQLGGYRGDVCYVASKAAIIGLTKIAARQAAEFGVTVNCVAPGPVQTGMFDRAMTPENIPALTARIPIGRVGQPDDVAAAVRYLVSEEAGWVTGATLDVNGGYRMQ